MKETAAQRAYRLRNRDAIRAKGRAYYRANREKWRGITRAAPGSLERRSQRFALFSRRRAKRFGCNGNVTPAELRAIAGPCHYCGDDATGWDHVIPLCRRGPNSIGNIVSCCRSCNLRKGRRTPDEWFAGVSVARGWV